MDPLQFYYQLQQQPFQPVRVHLTDGRTYDIPLRELVVVGKSFLVVGIQAPNESPGIIATSVRIPISDVRRTEWLTAGVVPEAG